MVISRKINKPYHPPIYMENAEIKEVSAHKHLGIFFSNDCSWHTHIDYIKEKAWKRINVMRKLKFVLDWKALETIYLSFIRPILEYGNTIWDNCTQYEKRELDKILHEAARIASGATALVSLQSLYADICWESLQDRSTKHKLNLFFKMQNDLFPGYLATLVPHHLAKSQDIIYEMQTISHQYTVEPNNITQRLFSLLCANGTIYLRKLNRSVP